MPTPRRKPSPTRRPQVAGLRRPGAKPSPRPRPKPYSAQGDDQRAEDQAHTTDTTDTVETTDTPEMPEAPDTPDTPDTADSVETADSPEAPETPEESETPEAAEDAETASDTDTADSDTADTADTDASDTDAAPVEDATETDETDETDEVAEEEAESEEEPKAAAAKSAGGGKRETPFWIAVALAVICAVAAGFFSWQYFAAEDLTGNKAQSDSLGSQQVRSEIVSAMERLFTYDYQQLDDLDSRVDELVASDKLHKHFTTLYCAVKEQAPKQKLNTATKASHTAITELSDTEAKAIVYVQNMWARGESEQTESTFGSVTVSAKLDGGDWKLTDIQIHGGDAGKEPENVPAKCQD